jgi:plastocyanin
MWLAGLALGLLAECAADATELTVSMAGMQYAPQALTARVGDVIRFRNDDAVDHEVFVPTQGFGVDFGPQKPGATVELSLAKGGIFDVECVFHPEMRLRVTVSQ